MDSSPFARSYSDRHELSFFAGRRRDRRSARRLLFVVAPMNPTNFSEVRAIPVGAAGPGRAGGGCDGGGGAGSGLTGGACRKPNRFRSIPSGLGCSTSNASRWTSGAVTCAAAVVRSRPLVLDVERVAVVVPGLTRNANIAANATISAAQEQQFAALSAPLPLLPNRRRIDGERQRLIAAALRAASHRR